MSFGKSKCHACGAAIEWLKLPEGGYMPCDPGMIYCVPDQDGDTYAADASGRVQRVRTVAAGGDCWLMRVPHRVTCTVPRRERGESPYYEPRRRAAPPPSAPEPAQEPPRADYAQISFL